MRRKFLIWLFAIICATFVVTGAVTYYQFRNHAQERASQILSTKLNDFQELLAHAARNLEQAADQDGAGLQDKARSMSALLKHYPAALKDEEALHGFCNALGVDEVCVLDANGKVVAAVPTSLTGEDFESTGLPHHGFAEHWQKDMQYEESPRRDAAAGGIVRVGVRARQKDDLRDAANFDKLVSPYKPGKNGHIIAFWQGEAINKDELPGSASTLQGLPLKECGKISLDDEDFYTYAVESEGVRLVGLMPVSELRQQTFASVARLLLSNFVLFVVMFLTVAYLVQRLVIRGIRVINTSLKRMTEGELDMRVEEHSCPEFSELSTGINAMADTLLGYAEHEHQRIRDELELARSIQFTALPSKFPAYPHHPEFDLYATCTQARVVGGDFYDFFKLDSKHLAFLVADVSATGIPAAMFMMRCMAAIRSVSRRLSDPQSIMAEVNKILCQGNDADMRLTLFFGNLDFHTGELAYCIAGPPQVLLQHAGGEFCSMPMESGKALGVSGKSVYKASRMTLEPGDRLFLYTEGVLKAMDAGNTPFGEERLRQALQRKASNATEVLRNVRASLRGFIGSEEPNMDITMLALEYQGALHAHAEITTHAGVQENVPATLATPMESVLAAPNCISDVQASVIAVLNALPEDLPVDIRLRCNDQEAQVTMRYAMPQFNPLVSLPHLPVDQTQYRTESETTGLLTLRKNLE